MKVIVLQLGLVHGLAATIAAALVQPDALVVVSDHDATMDALLEHAQSFPDAIAPQWPDEPPENDPEEWVGHPLTASLSVGSDPDPITPELKATDMDRIAAAHASRIQGNSPTSLAKVKGEFFIAKRV